MVAFPNYRRVDETRDADAFRRAFVKQGLDQGRRQKGEIEVLADRAFGAAFAPGDFEEAGHAASQEVADDDAVDIPKADGRISDSGSIRIR